MGCNSLYIHTLTQGSGGGGIERPLERGCEREILRGEIYKETVDESELYDTTRNALANCEIRSGWCKYLE